jgi:hypothetical protein
MRLTQYKKALHNALCYQNELTRRLIRKDEEIARLRAEIVQLKETDVLEQFRQVVNALPD